MSSPLFITIRQSFLILCIKIFSAEAIYIFFEYIFRVSVYDGAATSNTLFFVITLLKVFTFLYILLDWYYTFYSITSDTIEFRTGIFIKKIHSFPMSTVEIIKIQQTFLGRLFKFGNIILRSGFHGTEFMLRNIIQPRQQLKIFEQLHGPGLVEKIM